MKRPRSSIEGNTTEFAAPKETDGSNTGGIAWPDIIPKNLQQLHPHRLSRTISDMMKEWEITDPDTEEKGSKPAAENLPSGKPPMATKKED